MSIDDDIFDVEAALEGKPEWAGFDRITDYLAEQERVNEWQRQERRKLETTIRTLMDLHSSKLVVAALRILEAAGQATSDTVEDVIVNADNHPDFTWDEFENLMRKNTK